MLTTPHWLPAVPHRSRKMHALSQALCALNRLALEKWRRFDSETRAASNAQIVRIPDPLRGRVRFFRQAKLHTDNAAGAA